MGVSKEEITDLASRYISRDEITDFPFDGELFCLLSRELPDGKVLSDDEGWGFGGYAICIGYTFDEESKPHGKWIWMHYASLNSFPPQAQVLKLQPPHIVKGSFQNPERTHEIRMMKIDTKNLKDRNENKDKNAKNTEDNNQGRDNVVAFRPKKKK